MSEQQLVTDPTWGATPSVPPPAAPATDYERTRVDTNGIGVDHNYIVQKWADFASKHLPDKYAPMAAAIGTFLTDIPASILESVSAPESVATAGATAGFGGLKTPSPDIPLPSVSGARAALSKPADVMLDALVKKSGIDPDALDLAATKMRLAAAKSRTRQMAAASKIAEAQAPPAAAPTGALSPTEEAALYKQGYSPAAVEKIKAAASRSAATPAAAAPASPGAAGPVAPAPPAAPAIPAGSPPPPAATSPAPAMPAAQGMPKLTSAETSEFLRLQKQGKSMKDAFDLIAAQRAFAQRFGLPTAGDVRNAVVDRNAAGRWPE